MEFRLIALALLLSIACFVGESDARPRAGCKYFSLECSNERDEVEFPNGDQDDRPGTMETPNRDVDFYDLLKRSLERSNKFTR